MTGSPQISPSQHGSSPSQRLLAVVSGGLSQPSSTRLLADRLAEATVEKLRLDDVEVDVRVIELREIARDITNNLLTGFPSQKLASAIDAVTAADGLHCGDPHLQCELQRTLQVVHGCD